MKPDFDDFDDDTGSYDRGVNEQIGDSGVLLRRAIDIIATAPNMPLSSTPRIDRDEIIEILEEALHRLPDELRQARWMMKERDEFIARTRREADEVIEAAKVQAAAMLGWFDGQLAASDWLAAERFTLADIALLSIVDFAGWIGISLPADASHLQDWHQRATARTA